MVPQVNLKYQLKNFISVLVPSILILLFVTPIVTYDGWQYISSGKSLFDGTLENNYFFVRQPLYPFFVGLCLKIVDSLWVLIFIQYLINIASVIFFVNIVFKSFNESEPSMSIKRKKLFIYFFCWMFLGSFPSYLLAQNLFLPFLLILTSFYINYNKTIIDKTNIRNKKLVWINIFAPTFFISLSFLLAKELFVITLLITIYYLVKNKIYIFSTIFPLILGLILVFLSSASLSYIEKNAEKSPNFNLTNKQDPFANENLILNLKTSLININPPYTQRVINSFGSLTDLTPTIGWNGLIVDIYKNPNHPMRTFGMNHILQFGQTCNNFPTTGVIAVHKEYLSNKYFKCLSPIVKVPIFIKGITYLSYLLLWPLLVFFALTSRKLILNLGIVSLIFLFTYSLLGAGISRYGYPVYPIIILMAMINMSDIYSKVKSYD
jgi:hypothetical protein